MHNDAFNFLVSVCFHFCFIYSLTSAPHSVVKSKHTLLLGRPLHDIFRDLANKGSHVANAHTPRPAAVLDYLRSVIVCEDMKTLLKAYEVGVLTLWDWVTARELLPEACSFAPEQHPRATLSNTSVPRIHTPRSCPGWARWSEWSIASHQATTLSAALVAFAT